MKPKNPQSTAQKDYDADVIVVVDGDIDKENVTGGNGDVLYFDRQEPKPKAISLRIFHGQMVDCFCTITEIQN